MICKLALLLVGLAACDGDNGLGPHLASVSPAMAFRGQIVSVVGERLCGDDGDCAHAAGALRVGENSRLVQMTIVSYEDDHIEARIPEITPLGSWRVVLTVNEQASNALPMQIVELEF